MTWILPEGTKNPRYDKLDPVTNKYFDFAYNEKTGEGYRYNEDTREFILYIRDNGRYDQDDTLGKVRDPGIIRDENVLPKIVSAVLDGSTGVLTVSGSNFVAKAGDANDIDVSKLAIVAKNSESISLSDTSNVEITSPTSFTVNLAPATIAKLESVVDKNGTKASDNTVYNLAASEDWAAGAATDSEVADLVGNIVVTGLSEDNDQGNGGSTVTTQD